MQSKVDTWTVGGGAIRIISSGGPNDFQSDTGAVSHILYIFLLLSIHKTEHVVSKQIGNHNISYLFTL